LRYKIRNSLYEILGEYSASEILKRIASGRFSGEEEVASPPYDHWQKLASHPVFYDGFLRRIYADRYQAGSTFSEADPAPPPRELEPPIDVLQGKTQQVASDNTVHQEEIDALFSNGSIKQPSSPEPAGKTQVLELVSAEAPKKPLSVPEPPEEPLSPTKESPFRLKAIKPKQLVLGAVVVLGGIYLMWSPGSKLGEISDAAFKPAPTLGSSATAEERATTLGDEAEALMLQDTDLFYRGAYEVLVEALEADPNNPLLLGRLAMASARMAHSPDEAKQRRPEIERAIKSARRSDPHASELYRAEAVLSQALGKPEDANAFALKAAESNPVGSENLLLVGELHFAAGAFKEAKTVLLEAAKSDPKRVRARYFLSQLEWEMGNIDAAQKEGLETLKLNPLHPSTYLLLGEVAAARNDFAQARGLFETCGRLARFGSADIASRAYFRLGELQELSGNKGEAKQSFSLAFHYSREPTAALKQKVKGLDISKATLKKKAQESEYQGEYFQEQGTGLLSQGKTEEALRFFQAAHLLAPTDGLALIQLGEVMEKTASSYEDFRRVMSYYQRAIDRDPMEAMGYIKLGTLETEQYNFERGYKLLSQALALAPDSEKPYVALGKHYYKRQDYNESLNQFLKAAKINPSDSEILYYAGKLRLVYKKDGARDAQRFFSQAYTVDPRNYDALVEWLKIKVVSLEKNFAVKFVTNLIQSEKQNPMLYWVLGEIYAENKEYRRAITYYHQSLDLDNRQSKVRMSLAKALEAVGELEKAVAEYRLSSLLDRRNSEGFYRAADLLFQMRSYAQAEEVLKFLMGVTPNYPGVHRYLAKINALREQKDAAVESMKQEVANNPENYKFVLELAELYMDYARYDEAITELRRVTGLPATAQAPELKGEKIRAYLLLSRCYRAKAQPESAEGAVKLALQMDSNDPELHRELGYVYYSMQRDKEGVREFEYYLERAPAAQDVSAIRGLIKRMMIEE
jgi:tetratricopeptide (TPR) repeat protein